MDRATRKWALRIVPSASPESLAASRIAVAVAALFLLDVAWSPALGTIPRELWNPPLGTEAFANLVPANRSLVSVAATVFTLGIAGTLIGAWHRLSATSAAAAMLYLGWVHQLSGKTDHYHHILWFLVIIAVSPAADRWSVDAWRTRSTRARRRTDYAVPLAAMIVAIGLIYFFAGLAKLRLGGIDWILSDNLPNIMHDIWWQRGMEGLPLVDEAPIAQVLALVTVVFELMFLPAAVIPGLRRFAVGAGVVFHLGTWVVLGISFITLQILYVAFFDWAPIDSESRYAGSDRRSSRSPAGLAWVLTTALLIGVASFGAAHVERSWPMAAYPTFAAHSGGADRVLVEMEFMSASGNSVLLTDSELADRFSGPHAFAMMLHSLARLEAGDSAPFLQFLALFESVQGAEFGRLSAVDGVRLEVKGFSATEISRSRLYSAAT